MLYEQVKEVKEERDAGKDGVQGQFKSMRDIIVQLSGIVEENSFTLEDRQRFKDQAATVDALVEQVNSLTESQDKMDSKLSKVYKKQQDEPALLLPALNNTIKLLDATKDSAGLALN